MKDIYDRSSRRLMCPEASWLIDGVREGGDLLDYMPYCMPFKSRLKIFEREAMAERAKFQSPEQSVIKIRIRRSNVFFDGLEQLSKSGIDMKKRISVTFITLDGREESGIDIGYFLFFFKFTYLTYAFFYRGVFKEFWTQLSAIAFDPTYGLFVTNVDNTMYPNPNAKMIVGENYLQMYHFLGRVLGISPFILDFK